MSLRLHLGCGENHLPNWQNWDIRHAPDVDVVGDIRNLAGVRNNSVDTIYACHCIDHFSRWEWKGVLLRWFDVLKPGGKLYLSTPDFESIVDCWRSGTPLEILQGPLYARQDYPSNSRKFIIDRKMLVSALHQVGFFVVVIQMADLVPAIDGWPCLGDDSQAKLPNGRLLSVNLVVAKGQE